MADTKAPLDAKPQSPPRSPSSTSSAPPPRSATSPSPSSRPTSGPQGLPPRKPRQPKANKPLEAYASDTFEPDRKLPEDPAELEDALKMYKVMARPFVHGMSRTAVFLGTDPFDKPEIDGGELSLGALLYQAGGKIDARVLFIAWLGSVTMPRALQWMDKK